jgi:glucose 1-dehydrogenase
MELRLDGKVALVTGSSSGIGQGIAAALAQAGANVTVTYSSDRDGAETTADTVRAHGQRAFVAQVDVGAEEQVERLFTDHLTEFGRLDIFVNNAGIGAPGKIHEITTEQWDKVLRVNLYGAFFGMRLAARQMIAQGDGGRIITISSVHEESCSVGGGPYCVSKAGLRNLMRTMAIELGEHGITVNGIAPGMIVTEGMNRRAMEDEAYAAAAAELIVAKRVGRPADIANMAVFLASDQASYCTGATYYVDGGWMLTWPPV